MKGETRVTPVRTIPVLAGVAEIAGLDRVDYDEAFDFETDAVRRPEDWARLILEGAPLSKRLQMVGAWTALGIRLALPGTKGQVLGWRIRRSDPEAVVLEVHAAVGLTARIVIQAEPQRVTHSMVVRYDRALGGRVWRRIAPGHRRFVRALLNRARNAHEVG
jgi:hypothetical protein